MRSFLATCALALAGTRARAAESVVSAAPIPSIPAAATLPAAAAVPALAAVASVAPAPAQPKVEARLEALSASLGAGGSDRSGARDEAVLRSYFAGGPVAPDLSQVEVAAHALFRRGLPRLYQSVPVRLTQERLAQPPSGASAGEDEHGHWIHFRTFAADSNGEVPPNFGYIAGASIRQKSVQQKINHLITYAHEYAHVLFNVIIGMPPGNESNEKISHAMTEGLAVLSERLLIDRLIAERDALNLTQRDVEDLHAIKAQRAAWLPESYHYQEGFQVWRRVYQDGGEAAVERILRSFSPRRVATVERHDAAYLLSLLHPESLSAYLSDGDEGAIKAFGRMARGKPVSAEERRAVEALVARIGPEGWRKVLSETMFSPIFWSLPIEPSFALAELNGQAAEDLKGFLLRAAEDRSAWDRVVGHVGSRYGSVADYRRLAEIVDRADRLSWTAAERTRWRRAVGHWLRASLAARTVPRDPDEPGLPENLRALLGSGS